MALISNSLTSIGSSLKCHKAPQIPQISWCSAFQTISSDQGRNVVIWGHYWALGDKNRECKFEIKWQQTLAMLLSGWSDFLSFLAFPPFPSIPFIHPSSCCCFCQLSMLECVGVSYFWFVSVIWHTHSISILSCLDWTMCFFPIPFFFLNVLILFSISSYYQLVSELFVTLEQHQGHSVHTSLWHISLIFFNLFLNMHVWH